MKKGVILFLVFLLSISAVSALQFSASATKIKNAISVDEAASFTITITNNGISSEIYTISNLEYPFWDIYTKPLQNPIEVTIAPGQSESVTIYVDPLHIIS